MDSMLRRVRNTQRSNIAFKDGTPSKSTLTEGEELMAMRKNKGLSLFRRQKGILWWMNFTKDGNEVVEKDLKVNKSISSGGDITSGGYIKTGTTFKSSDGSSGINGTISIVDAVGTHSVIIKDGLITSWTTPSPGGGG